MKEAAQSRMKSTDLQNYFDEQPKAAAAAESRTKTGSLGGAKCGKFACAVLVGRRRRFVAPSPREQDGMKSEPLWHTAHDFSNVRSKSGTVSTTNFGKGYEPANSAAKKA
jgi:hypothetical protein